MRAPIQLILSFASFAAIPLAGQAPSGLQPAERPFVAVDAPIVALTNVTVIDGTQNASIRIRGQPNDCRRNAPARRGRDPN